MQDKLMNGGYIPLLFSFPGFILDYITADLMHVSDLGVVQYVLGCTMFELFKEMGGLVSIPKPILADLMVMVKQASKTIWAR